MSDDSFIREVEEELRSDKLKSFWERFGTLIIGGIVLIIAVTAGTRLYDYYTTQQANASGDQFLEALTLANEGKSEEALTALQALEENGYGQYPVLARMRAATVLANDGKPDEAAAAFDAIAADTSVPTALREMAQIRSGYALIDTAEYSEVARRVEALSNPEHTLRHAAREVMGLSAYRNERWSEASTFFNDIADDESSPAGMAERARVMIELLNSSGKVSEG